MNTSNDKQSGMNENTEITYKWRNKEWPMSFTSEIYLNDFLFVSFLCKISPKIYINRENHINSNNDKNIITNTNEEKQQQQKQQ